MLKPEEAIFLCIIYLIYFFHPPLYFFNFFLIISFENFFFTDFFPAFWQKWPPLSGSMSEIHKSVYSRLKLNWIESNWGACCRIVSFLFASNVVFKCSECEWHRRSRFLFFFFVYSFLFLDLTWQVFFYCGTILGPNWK